MGGGHALCWKDLRMKLYDILFHKDRNFVNGLL